MTKTTEKIKYILISPVKDEDKYIEETIKSVVCQTVKPAVWIIIDDGSKDKTAEIIASYAGRYDWIKIAKISRDTKRQPGSGVINAFLFGYQLIKNEKYDYIVKLDCDLRFEPNYFEKIFANFSNDKSLGIASGIYLENSNDTWLSVQMPSYHAAGACKVLRKECFDQIGGFVPHRGWDTIDEIKAQVRGWKTTHFKDIHFYHLKKEGSGIGPLRTNVMHGQIYYLTGGSTLFFLLKVTHRMVLGRPAIIAGMMMLYGFIKALISRERKLVSRDEANHYSKILNDRLFSVFRRRSVMNDKDIG